MIYLDHDIQGEDQCYGGGLAGSESLVAEGVGVNHIRECCDKRERRGEKEGVRGTRWERK